MDSKDDSKDVEEMWEWLNSDKEVCSKCGLVELPENYPYYKCEKCRIN